MKKKYSLTFHEVHTPITEPVTKFGGQPVWITEPQWPLSRKLGTPMQFICQIRLYPELFGSLDAHMAYIFMTDHINAHETWEPDAGENAVILQPGTWTRPTLLMEEGPSLYKLVPDESGWPRTKVPCEFAVELHPGEDSEELATPWPDMTDEELEEDDDALDDEAWTLKHQTNPTAWDIRYRASREDKIGGIPVPAADCDAFPYPDQEAWQLILQLAEDTEDKRFVVNFGSDGVGYALLSADGRVGKFLWMR